MEKNSRYIMIAILVINMILTATNGIAFAVQRGIIESWVAVNTQQDQRLAALEARLAALEGNAKEVERTLQILATGVCYNLESSIILNYVLYTEEGIPERGFLTYEDCVLGLTQATFSETP